VIYLQLFATYFKIGLFGFGGGYAMLSLIRHEVVERHQWLTAAEFTDIIALSQATPGPIGINSATYVGYTVTGEILGAIVATFALCLPSFIIGLLVARSYRKFRSNVHVADAFAVLRPLVPGLIAAAALLLMNGENFIDTRSILLFALAFLLTMFTRIHPILLILLSALAGLLLY
jgi:chromate transporter